MDAKQSRAALEAELESLRQRVAALEAERRMTTQLLHGDPELSAAPLVEQVPAFMWATDRDLRVTWWAGGAIPSARIRPEDVLGVDVHSFVESRDLDRSITLAHENALRGEPGSYEAELNAGIFSVHVGPQYDGSREVCGVVGVAIEITERVHAERELRAALDRLRTLSGLIPICMHCKNVRNDGGFWEQVETYVREHSNAEFTHAICPDCMRHKLDGGTPEA
jgi:PAS domain S-box-containing protein